jgi:adenosylhomocysteine nucleosidase
MHWEAGATVAAALWLFHLRLPKIRPPVIVVCAVDEEACHVRAKLENTTESVVPCTSLRRTTGTYDGIAIELVICNIGQSNAASAATAIMLQRLLAGLPAPSAVISCGCSGAHRAEIAKGCVVVGTEVKPVAQAKILVDGSVVPKGYRCTCQTPLIPSLYANPQLLAAARAVAAARYPEGAILFGPVASSDTWMCAIAKIHELHALFGTLCEEMEASAVAQVCDDFSIPFLAIKDISNNELHHQSKLAKEATRQSAGGLDLSSIGQSAAAMTLATISEWARQ